MKRLYVLGISLLFLFACVARPAPVTRPEDALEQTSWWRAASPDDDREFADIAAAVRQSLEYYQKLPPGASFSLGPDRVSVLDMIVTLQNFLLIIENSSLTSEQKAEQIKREFTLYRSVGSNGRGKVLFTGYFEPTLSCRPVADDVYKYPLYKRPDDILEVDLAQFGNGFPKSKLLARLDGKKVVPYFSREEIDREKAIAGRDLEMLWCSDILDIYTLQVQGSGKADLGDGNIVSILYDGQNGRPYKSIGKYLIDTGVIPKEAVSMQVVRQYLSDNPDKIAEVLDQNPSYVFFRMDTGPSVGNIGVPLTPNRSIATDSRLFPRGALALISTTKPVIEDSAIKQWVSFTRFVVNQDTGGAIKGPGRVDLFWGQGPEAELGAGSMQQEGELYFLMRKK
jgi:membrane-bound lytic murein transglycosylase A